MPWNSAERVDITRKYNSLLYKDDYLKIQDFLCDEKLVTEVIQELYDEYFYDCESPKTFTSRLTNVERFLGPFSYNVKRIGGVLTPADFLQYVYAGRPLYDHGVTDAHGANTHRMQWLMIAQYREKTKDIQQSARSLYANLACANSYALPPQGTGTNVPKGSDFIQTGVGWLFLWDDLVDRNWHEARNATSPEWLHNFFLEENFRALKKVWK